MYVLPCMQVIVTWYIHNVLHVYTQYTATLVYGPLANICSVLHTSTYMDRTCIVCVCVIVWEGNMQASPFIPSLQHSLYNYNTF